MRCAIIDTETNIVLNVIVADLETDSCPVENAFLAECGTGNIGDTYDPQTSEFAPPPNP